MKKIVLSFLILAFAATASYATNVSGGIYANTTWTVANSPYIVTDTVVVFPGVTLTIQPGVVVKFDDNIILEIRQAFLSANGTSADSITFTSNASTPTPGIYGGIYLNGGSLQDQFNFCNFKYANMGIDDYSNATIVIKNSNFKYNLTGIYSPNNGAQSVSIDSCNFINNINYGIDFTYSQGLIIIDHCNVTNNGNGISAHYHNGDIIRNCNIENNQIGLYVAWMLVDNCHIGHNQIGISTTSENRIKNCSIDSNTVTGIITIGDSVINCHIGYNDSSGLYAGGSVIKGNIIEYNGINIDEYSGYGGSVIIENVIRYGNVGIDNASGIYTIKNNIIENNLIGMNLRNSGSTIYCNMICNNTTYDLIYSGTSNVNISNNYWCTPDSASTEAVVYDGFDNINYGLALFMPLDTQNCYQSGNCSAYFYLYPDPFTQHNYYAVNLTSGVQPLTYLWSWGDGTFDTNPYPSHVYSVAGYYNICLSITDQIGCTQTYCDSNYLQKNTNTIITVNVISASTEGITENYHKNSISVFPNPAFDNITITGDANNDKVISIYNIQGEILMNQTLQQGNSIINISSLSKGIYFIKVNTAKGIAVKKFIKE